MSTIGLLPAAGKATRIGGIPKWLLPVPEGTLLDVHCQRMRLAGVSHVLIAAGEHNRDLLLQHAPANAIVYEGRSRTMAEDVLLARAHTGDNDVLFGMPDTYFGESLLYDIMRKSHYDADVVLALWRTQDDQRGKLGQVAVNDDGYVTDVVDKSLTCPYPWAWGAMLWNPVFWDYIKPDMPHVGYALMPAIKAGLRIKARFVYGEYTDCGTPEAYWRLCSTFVKEAVK